MSTIVYEVNWMFPYIVVATADPLLATAGLLWLQRIDAKPPKIHA